MNVCAKAMGHALISEIIFPEFAERMDSNDFEKWCVHICPESRWATEKEKRAWNRFTARPTDALNRNAVIMKPLKSMRKRFGVSMPRVLVNWNARLRCSDFSMVWGSTTRPMTGTMTARPKISTMLLRKIPSSRMPERLRSRLLSSWNTLLSVLEMESPWFKGVILWRLFGMQGTPQTAPISLTDEA